jgi:putative transposase
MRQALTELTGTVGVERACAALGMSRASYYRHLRPKATRVRGDASPPWSLSPEEAAEVLRVLHSDRFVDKAPAEIVATLLDDGVYLCSERTMYRLLAAHGELRERRAQVRRRSYKAPELLATGPNQVWSWDITKLKGPGKWNYFCLYVILDIFSRMITGWCLANRESADLAKDLIAQACLQQRVQPGQLTIHADRGSAMTSKPVSELLLQLDVVRSHSRPHVSNDNPFSEAQFKTLKYQAGFPARFGSEEDARLYCRGFVPWYNTEHRHSGICMLTPEMVHQGRAAQVLARRHAVMWRAYQANPDRFPRPPRRQELPGSVWINRPNVDSLREVAASADLQ